MPLAFSSRATGSVGSAPFWSQAAHLLLVELDERRLVLGVVAPDDLDELAVPRRMRVGGNDAIDRILLGADPRQPELHCHCLYLFAFFFRLLADLRVALGRGFPLGAAGMVPGREGILPEPIIFIIFAICFRPSIS